MAEGAGAAPPSPRPTPRGGEEALGQALPVGVPSLPRGEGQGEGASGTEPSGTPSRVEAPGFSFETIARDPAGSRARVGRYATPHGAIETPNFIFCGTKATVKGLLPRDLREAGTGIVLANTYHLMLQPTADVVAAAGGLHRFMGWDGPMLTDSGGFQVFSMGHGGIADEVKGRRGGNGARPPTRLEIAEEGVVFRSYLDGRRITLTPEESVELQRKLGPDMIVQFDECTPFHVTRDYTANAMRRSIRWGDRCVAAFERAGGVSYAGHPQALYGIVSGGVYEDLRRESAEYTRTRPFFATAVGDCLGATREQMYEVVAATMPHVHPDRPVHLLGIGGIRDIFEGVAQGIDTFDCVSPTRIARHGWALVPGAPGERVNMRNGGHRTDHSPVDETCGCVCCREFTRAYVHHLLKAEEMLGLKLLSIHNVFTMNRLMRDVRAAIRAGTLAEARARWLGPEG